MNHYKIRKLNSFGEYVYSNGTVTQNVRLNTAGVYYKVFSVGWTSRKGKQWTNKVLLQKHLLKSATVGVDMTGWEIVEVIETPAGSIDDWFDKKMLMKLLKEKG